MNERKLKKIMKQIQKLGYRADHCQFGEEDVVVVASPEGFNFASKDGPLLEVLQGYGLQLWQIHREDLFFNKDGFSWADEPLRGCVDSIVLYFKLDPGGDCRLIWDNSYPIKEVYLDLYDWYFPSRYHAMKTKRAWTAVFKAMAWSVEILEMREKKPTKLRICDRWFHFDWDEGGDEKILWALLPDLRLVSVTKENDIPIPKWYCRSLEEHSKEFEKKLIRDQEKLRAQGINIDGWLAPTIVEHGLALIVEKPVQHIEQVLDFQDAESFEQYALKRCAAEYGEEHAKILELIFQQVSQAEVAHQVFGDPNSQPTVSKRLSEIRLKSLGYWFEDWYRFKQGLLLVPDNEKNKPIPDAVVEGIPHSLKCYLNTRRTVSLPRNELGPELQYAKDHNTGVRVVFYSAYYHQEIIKDYSKSDEVPITITLRFS